MFTELLAIGLAVFGLAAILLGLVTAARLRARYPWWPDLFECCAIVACIASGAALIGLAQALRVLLAVNGKL